MIPCESPCDMGSGVASTTFASAIQFLAASQCLLTEPWPQQSTLQNGSRVDIIIVGSGTAGSALAARLAETNLTVLLLEAGGDPPIESIIPGLRGALLKSPYDWNFTTVDDGYSSQELLNRRQRLRLGFALGGTGSINVNIYSRGFPADYDEWAETLGGPTWNWNNVLPYFKKFEKLRDPMLLNNPHSRQYHGYEGDIEVAGVDKLNPDTIKLMDAFTEMGFKVIEDRNNPETIGVYHLSFTVKDGKRHSSLTAMLNKVAGRKNLHVMKNAFVTKVLIHDKTAYGVKVLIENKEWEFYANKEVIVSAGAYNTPKILMLSGIGPKDHLQEHGIEVIKDLPVGNNLQDHFSLFTYIAADSGTCDYSDKYYIGQVIDYLYNRTGMLSVPSRMGLDYALKGSSTPNIPDYSMYGACSAKNSNFFKSCMQELSFTPEMCEYLESVNKKHELIMFNVILRKPKSRGTVRLASTNPLEKPIITSGAFSVAEDLESFPEAMQVIWSLTNTSYFRSKNAFVVDMGVKRCEGLSWPEDVKCLVRSLIHSESHVVSTAAMGPVLDSRMRVRGMRRLRVVDASAMPSVPRANMNAPVIMVAEKAADFIKEEYSLLEHYHM